MQKFNRLSVADVMRVLFRIEGLNTGLKGGGSSHKLSAAFARITNTDNIEIARYGIERHLYYAKRCGTGVSVNALYEIIKDAESGMNYAEQNEIEAQEVRKLNSGIMPNKLFYEHLLRRVARKVAQS